MNDLVRGFVRSLYAASARQISTSFEKEVVASNILVATGPVLLATGPFLVPGGFLLVATGPFLVAGGPLLVATGPLLVASGVLQDYRVPSNSFLVKSS